MTGIVADRFSDLPDELIWHIYSYLDMKEVLGTTLISRKWRYIWRSLDILNFSEHNSWELVSHILLRRNGSNIQKLCLSNSPHLHDRFFASVYSAVKHVQEIHLENINICHSFVGEVETLVWKKCGFPGKTFTIFSSGLKYLIIDNTKIFSSGCEFWLCAPSLKTLQLKGSMFDGYHMENLSSLDTAELYVPILDMYSKTREMRRSCFSHIFNGVRHVESLTISIHCFKFLSGLFDGLEVLPISFNKLKKLKLTDWSERGYIKVMPRLFGCFPKLENLSLERTETCSTKKEGDSEAILSSENIFGHLKVVEIQNSNGSKDEYKFLEFLLNNAMVLEMITMKVTTILSEEKVKERVDLTKKLHMMHKASLNVTFRLMMKIEGRYTVLFEE